MINHATHRTCAVSDGRAALRQITTEQLRELGVHQMAYVRCASCDGERAFVLFDANGTPLGSAATTDAVCEAAAERGLTVIAIH